MAVIPIDIPDNPSLAQMQAIQFEVTKRMNVFLEIVAESVEQEGTAKFVFAGENAKLNLPTLDKIIREIKRRKAAL